MTSSWILVLFLAGDPIAARYFDSYLGCQRFAAVTSWGLLGSALRPHLEMECRAHEPSAKPRGAWNS